MQTKKLMLVFAKWNRLGIQKKLAMISLIDKLTAFVELNLIDDEFFEYSRSLSDVADLVEATRDDPPGAYDYFEGMMERLDSLVYSEKAEGEYVINDGIDETFESTKAKFLIVLMSKGNQIAERVSKSKDEADYVKMALKHFYHYASSFAGSGEPWADTFEDFYYNGKSEDYPELSEDIAIPEDKDENDKDSSPAMSVMMVERWEDIPKNYTGIIEYPDGTKYWYLNGKLHRTDGPAIEYADGTKSWYLNGEVQRSEKPSDKNPEDKTPNQEYSSKPNPGMNREDL